MTLLVKLLLVIHIFSGFISLLSGFLVVVLKKGTARHKSIGKAFFIAMITVAVSALALSLIRPNNFLLMIAIFAFYQNYTGYRAVKNKKLRPNAADYAVMLLAALNAFWMILQLDIALMVFGILSLVFVSQEAYVYSLVLRGKAIPPATWLSRHIGMMMGAFIASATAFVVVNVNHFQPAWIPWLLPTMLGVPLIIYFSAKYLPKKRTGRRL